MYKRIITGLSVLIGLSFGVTVGPGLWMGIPNLPSWISNIYLNAFIFMIIFTVLGSLLSPFIERVIRYLIEWMNNLTTLNLIVGTIGTLIGLLIGFLLSLPFNSLNIPFVSSTLPLIFSITLALVGYQTAMSRKDEWRKLFSRSMHKSSRETEESQLIELATSDNMYKYKLLDTSVIIDSRIADIVRTNFIEGTLVIPNFVLQELQFIADSADSLKRAKGRRGLDTLNALQKDGQIPIEFYEGDFDDIAEVDSKLIRLAKLMDAAILTNDYNLNKVCEFQNVKVFNINELANAVKPVVIPGEEMHVQVIKSGTERKQGVAYLDDGTMIVVEDGQNYMNQWIDVVVTSALQTAAGRMIFAKPVE
ncbi:PIN domain-containing protein [Tuanshanicoccus lijuaniae]|uniref:PIN domain-containing protein n=1 Tax=Aerococcaceae bacterium zg-1292 TaxID=2774330 RepID=UPI001BD80999|nr:PIN/TRAM domain-containing protein [Aerococcaceae bacterium zg-A91]MBS4458205.1 PIN/TRAM domain-containing protein [Aerococcaceae bacterium zg-BR33]